MNKITGTMIAGILGISKYMKPVDVWMQAKGLITVTQNEAMETGLFLEAYLRSKLENIFRKRIDPIYLEDGVFAGHLDGLTDDAVVEFKTTRKEDEVAIEWNCQVQWYMMLSNRKKAYIYVAKIPPLSIDQFKLLLYKGLIDDFAGYSLYEVNRDDVFIDYAKAKALEFHKLLQEELPPSDWKVDPGLIYPKGMGYIEATDEIYEKCLEYKRLKEEIKQLEKKAENIKTEIQNFMQDKEILTYAGVNLLTWKTQTRETVDLQLLKAEKPEIYEMYKKVTTYRIFNEIKGGVK